MGELIEFEFTESAALLAEVDGEEVGAHFIQTCGDEVQVRYTDAAGLGHEVWLPMSMVSIPGGAE